MYSFVGTSPFPEGGGTAEHFGGADAISRGWTSPVSEPGSPEAVSPGRARPRNSSAVGGDRGIVEGVGGGGGGGMLSFPRVGMVCLEPLLPVHQLVLPSALLFVLHWYCMLLIGGCRLLSVVGLGVRSRRFLAPATRRGTSFP